MHCARPLVVLTRLLQWNAAIGWCGGGRDKQYQPSLHAGLISWWLIPAKGPMSVYLLQGCGLCSHCPVHSAVFTIQMGRRHAVRSPVGEMWDHSLFWKVDDLFIGASALIVILTLTEATWLSYVTVHYQSESNYCWSSHTFTPCGKPQTSWMVMIMGKTMLLNQKNLF